MRHVQKAKAEQLILAVVQTCIVSGVYMHTLSSKDDHCAGRVEDTTALPSPLWPVRYVVVFGSGFRGDVMGGRKVSTASKKEELKAKLMVTTLLQWLSPIVVENETMSVYNVAPSGEPV